MARITFLAVLLSITSLTLSAQQPENIVDEIQSLGIISVEMPHTIYERLQPVEPQVEEREALPSTTGRMAGYRIQAFSGNSDTAKREGQAREAKVRSYFPEYECYLVYNAPYWRLRVGDFRTRAEAEEVAAAMKKAFPAFKREITVVRDRITINQ